MRLTFLKSALLAALWLAAGSLAHAAAPLPALGTDAKQNTVSGLSSGAFMAAQFSVANSAAVSGAGIVAGGARRAPT